MQDAILNVVVEMSSKTEQIRKTYQDLYKGSKYQKAMELGTLGMTVDNLQQTIRDLRSRHEFLEKIAIADIAFEVNAPTLDKLFEDAGMAASDIMVNPKTLKPKLKKTLKMSADTLENLMYDFLSELIFLKDTKGLLFNKYSIKVK